MINGTPLGSGRRRPAGLIFFNDEGDETGGLVFGGNQAGAGAGLTFDRYKQDQTVSLQYQESNGKPRAGLTIYDRSNTPLDAAVEQEAANRARVDAVENEQARQALIAQLTKEANARGDLAPRRVFVGRETDGMATLALADAHDHRRLVLSVGPDGAALIQFLDASGKVTRTFKP